jgi:hypothetical protein
MGTFFAFVGIAVAAYVMGGTTWPAVRAKLFLGAEGEIEVLAARIKKLREGS